jgi:outer membrane scaffolding protein for murein synthesis (MipA/OmpV family)
VTVQACSPRWTLTTFRLGAGDHETDVSSPFLRHTGATFQPARASSGVSRPARAPRVNQTAALTYHYSQHVLLRGFATIKELTGSFADSPIVESKTQAVIGVGAGYHF